MNKKNLAQSTAPPAVQHRKDLESECIVQHKDDLCPEEDTEEVLYGDGLSSDDSAGELLYGDVVACTCGAQGRAHKRECPMNSRQYFSGSVLEPDAVLNASTAKVLERKRGLHRNSGHLKASV